jgi:hypothetical protein
MILGLSSFPGRVCPAITALLPVLKALLLMLASLWTPLFTPHKLLRRYKTDAAIAAVNPSMQC